MKILYTYGAILSFDAGSPVVIVLQKSKQTNRRENQEFD